MHSSFYESGGQELVPLIVSLSLQRLGHEVDCFGAIIDKGSCHPQLIRKVNVEYYAFEIPVPLFSSSLNHFLSYALAPVYINRFKKYDVMLCFQQPSAWIARKVKEKFKVPYIYFAQGILRELYPRPLDIEVKTYMRIERPVAFFFAEKLKVFQKVDNEAVKKADAIIANSMKTAKELQGIYRRNDIEVCYPGVDVHMFKPLPLEEVRYIFTKFNILKPFIFTSNRHEPHKKLEWLFLMMRSILENDPNVMLVAVGGFNRFYTPYLLQFRKKLGLEQKVKFVGRVSLKDLISLYNASKVCVFTSPEEDFGLGPMEAMACGTPVVAWNNAGPAETVINGATGLLAKPFDLKDFAEKVVTILKSDEIRARMGRRGISHVKKNFTLDNFIRKIQDILSHHA